MPSTSGVRIFAIAIAIAIATSITPRVWLSRRGAPVAAPRTRAPRQAPGRTSRRRALQRASGAEVAALPKSVPVLRTGLVGPDDPQHAIALPFPPVSHLHVIAVEDTVRVGPLRVVAHATPGPTPGGTSWSWQSWQSWQSCQSGQCLDFVYADSRIPVSADGFLYSRSAAYPDVLTDFERGFRTLERLSCDVLITPHPRASNLWGRLAGREGATLVDREACQRYATGARAALAKRLDTEKR